MEYNKVSKNTKLYIIIIILICFCVSSVLVYYLKKFFLYNLPYIQNYINITFICNLLLTVIFILSIILMLFLPRLIATNFGYKLNGNLLNVKSGIVFENVTTVLLSNVYKMVINKKIIGRILNICTVCLTTNAGDVKIYFLDSNENEKLIQNIAYSIKNYKGMK